MASRAILLLSLAALASHTPAAARARAIAPLALAGAPASLFPAPDRPVAEIVSPIWSTEEARDAADESGQLVRLLRLEPGASVADIGAGSGYHTVRLAPILGSTGRVIAQDIVLEYLAGLDERVRRLGLRNVTLALGEPHDPRLPEASVDTAILVHVYHEIEQPYAFLHNLAPALRPGGRVGVVDLDRPTARHGTPPDLLRCEFEAVGYEQVGFAELTGDLGYLAVFTPPDAARRVPPGSIEPCSEG